ncbi:aminotransferase class V-fold PLP-dependent enzyme [Legionella longbeachae]|uniref:aminotransferase class V-fold PLP-dependent enzyme n=1 Tax=Legionella longbeachae TaxID=450 RepID=UPI000A1BFF46|nr:aminotransferase class V-fold PLP-dependent enzyme [Legionella longbeachae]ARM32133.1 aminotransferase class V-fold PLP-dependent enzyme [Legionella longbeachae]QEY51348.1 aminotransferase class V-fold PLP-dependent enzyme [Legionella longbeachae]
MDNFPHTKSQIYLNHAAVSPFSLSVKEEIIRYVEERHIKNIENYFSFQPIIENVYKKIAALLHTDPLRICLTPNTSTGLNILANGYPWKKGDRILLNKQEFPANIYPFLNCQRQGVEIDYIDNKEPIIESSDIENAIKPNTRLLSISMVQFLNGHAIDLAKIGKICKQNDTLFCVDAIQGLGATDLEVEQIGIDFLSCGSHKWLMAPEGLGFIYVTNELQEKLTPSYVGWLGVENPWELLNYDLRFQESAKRYQTGTMNHIAIAGLNASLEHLTSIGYTRIKEKITANTQFFLDNFPQLQWITPQKMRLGIVTFKHPEAERIHQELNALNITVSVREGQYLRISPHYYHQKEELEKAAIYLEHIVNKIK